MKNSRRILGLLGCICWVLLAGACSKTEAPEGKPMDFSSAPTAPQTAELTFTPPDGWVEETPSSSMRRLQYRLPSPSGDVELAVFAEIGGTPEQNINRWISQFTTDGGEPVADKAKVTRDEVGGLNLTILDVEGTYSGAMSAPMAGQASSGSPDYRMLAAVIETGRGPWFIKLTGPRESVTQWETSFQEFVRSARSK